MRKRRGRKRRTTTTTKTKSIKQIPVYITYYGNDDERGMVTVVVVTMTVHDHDHGKITLIMIDTFVVKEIY